jgi:uncharacterized damage-inducible protein DinB
MTADPRYPIGKFVFSGPLDEIAREDAIEAIASLPWDVEDAIEGLSEAQLDTPYRDGGWTVRQVVHHLADSHINSCCRLKLALTEEKPTVRVYDEAKWAQLPDYALPVDASLDLLSALHARWVALWESLEASDWRRTLLHPERGEMTVDELLAFYAWHGAHHVAHITRLREARGW